MPNQFAAVLIASVLCSASAAGLAQPASPPAAPGAPPTTVHQLTVIAPPKPKLIEKQTYTFVKGYAAAPNPEVDQIGRWHDPVCVKVLGLPQADQAAVIKARIESVARAVGLPAARAGCRANVEIVFSDEPQRIMDIVARLREVLLGYYHLHDRDRLKQVTHPIQSWYVTETEGDPFGLGPKIVVDDANGRSANGCAGSRIATECLESKFKNVFIVADNKALEGKDVGLVADYMVMLALSQPSSLEGCNALPSVIELFAKSACPGRDADGLTPADAAYLTALYAADLSQRKPVERVDIAHRMAKILIQANSGGG